MLSQRFNAAHAIGVVRQKLWPLSHVRLTERAEQPDQTPWVRSPRRLRGTYATALALGGLLLARAVAVNRGASKSSKSLLELKPVRVRPSDLGDRNLR